MLNNWAISSSFKMFIPDLGICALSKLMGQYSVESNPSLFLLFSQPYFFSSSLCCVHPQPLAHPCAHLQAFIGRGVFQYWATGTQQQSLTACNSGLHALNGMLPFATAVKNLALLEHLVEEAVWRARTNKQAGRGSRLEGLHRPALNIGLSASQFWISAVAHIPCGYRDNCVFDNEFSISFSDQCNHFFIYIKAQF